MSDVLYGGNSSYTSHGNIGSFSDTNSPGSAGSTLETGDLRRKFNFGDRVSELALAQDLMIHNSSSQKKEVHGTRDMHM